MEEITDADYKHAKRVWKDCGIQKLVEFHAIYQQSDTLLPANTFKNFCNKCIEISELDPAYFLSAPGLAWQARRKKTELELRLLADVDMLLIVEKGIRDGICHAIHWYAKANSKYIKDYDKIKELSYLMY